MTLREMNLNVFAGRPNPHVFFQPRFEPWYAWHHTVGKMPQRYASMSLLDMYDDLGASMRTVHYYTGQPDPIVRSHDRDVKITESLDAGRVTKTFHTPHGDLSEQFEHTLDDTWRQVSFAIKTPDDLRAFVWLMERTHFHFDVKLFEQGERYVGDRGVPQFWVPKSPYQALLQTWWKMEELVYAMADCPREVEAAMEAIDRSYDSLYEELCASGRLQILNFGENMHEQLICPDYFERYYLPFFQKRCDQLHAAGIYSHVHVDGYWRNMLPWLKRFPQDGIEALTPKPQGDMTLAEIKEHIGDKVLLDGIPAVLFLDTYSREQLMQCAEEVVRLFHPRLILGISDELPEGCGEEGIERMRLVSQWCRTV